MPIYVQYSNAQCLADYRRFTTTYITKSFCHGTHLRLPRHTMRICDRVICASAILVYFEDLDKIMNTKNTTRLNFMIFHLCILEMFPWEGFLNSKLIDVASVKFYLDVFCN
jgi:hypothetical protein